MATRVSRLAGLSILRVGDKPLEERIGMGNGVIIRISLTKGYARNRWFQ